MVSPVDSQFCTTLTLIPTYQFTPQSELLAPLVNSTKIYLVPIMGKVSCKALNIILTRKVGRLVPFLGFSPYFLKF